MIHFGRGGGGGGPDDAEGSLGIVLFDTMKSSQDLLNNFMKVITVTPAGRKKYLEILCPYLLKNKHIISEHHFWVNTTNKEDIEYLNKLASENTFFKLVPIPKGTPNKNTTICLFFENCVDKDAVYIRFDDDICWMANDAVEKLVNYRIRHPEPFIVSGNVVNNSICTHLHQRFGNIPIDIGMCGYNRICDNGWKSPEKAVTFHECFLEALKGGVTDRYKFPAWYFHTYEDFSINCISFLGKDFAEFGGKVGHDEELWLTHDKPKELGRRNCIYGDALFAHFSYYTQRNVLEGSTNLLDVYKELAHS